MEIIQLDISDIKNLQAYFIALGKVYLENTICFYPSFEDLSFHFCSEKDHDPELFLGIREHNQHAGFIYAIKRSPKSKTGFIKWMNAKDQNIGQALLVEIEKRLKAKGCSRIEYGGSSPSYLVPGVPENDIFLKKALKQNGWKERGKRESLIVDPSESDPTGETLDYLKLVLPEAKLHTTYEPEPLLHKFIADHFSESWAEKTSMALLMNKAAHCTVLTIDRRILGFVGVHITNPNWIGPIGLDSKFRGRELGKMMIAHAMKEAIAKNATSIMLPWVEEMKEFYLRIFPTAKTSTFIKTTRIIE